jgi:signal transduction histidine kinase
VHAIEATAARFEARTGVACRFCADLPPLAAACMPEGMRAALYRIAQEALTNVARHAHARSARVTLRAEMPSLGEPAGGQSLFVLHLSVADDGRGFDASQMGAESVPLGLLGMKERAAEWGGCLSVEAKPGGGTCVEARIPVAAPYPEPDAEASA